MYYFLLTELLSPRCFDGAGVWETDSVVCPSGITEYTSEIATTEDSYLCIDFLVLYIETSVLYCYAKQVTYR